MRLGILPRGIIKKLKGGKVIWLQAVSVGEAVAAGKLWELLRREYPDYRLAISTTTKTGNQIARNMAGSGDTVLYFPLDLSFIVQRVIKRINPKLFLTVETEIWPNVIRALFRKAVPIILVNGRISSHSFTNYKKVRYLLKSILKKINLFCMQTEEDASRIICLGAPRERVRVTGNMKFDCQLPTPNQQLPDLGLLDKEELLIAGSTHKGEEDIILEAYKEIVKDHALRLLIAPRHIERVEQIERIIAKYGFASVRVSRLSVSGLRSPVSGQNRRQATGERRPVYILDSIGRLSGMYALAAIVFVGGSLIDYGGHNLIEPAVFAKPVLFGPHTSNFQDIAELFLKYEAGIIVKDAKALEGVCKRLLRNPGERIAQGGRAKRVVEENRGASERNLELIRSLLIEGERYES